MNAEKETTFVQHVVADLAVACEQQDFDEMLGNVLEYAFFWCRKKVAVSATPKNASVAIVTEDDGPGLSP